MAFDGNIRATHSEMSYGSISENNGTRKIFMGIGSNVVVVTPDEAKGYVQTIQDLISEADRHNKMVAKRAAEALREQERAIKKSKRGGSR